MKKTIAKIALGAVCLTSFAGISFADANDMVVHNLINNPSNAAYDWHWGSQIPAWQVGKLSWGMMASQCAPNTECTMQVFTDVDGPSPKYVADVTLNFIDNVVVNVVNKNTPYSVCKDVVNSTELYLVKNGSVEFKRYC